jgi:hypothetical protein
MIEGSLPRAGAQKWLIAVATSAACVHARSRPAADVRRRFFLHELQGKQR